jgi:hypothetical protein
MGPLLINTHELRKCVPVCELFPRKHRAGWLRGGRGLSLAALAPRFSMIAAFAVGKCGPGMGYHDFQYSLDPVLAGQERRNKQGSPYSYFRYRLSWTAPMSAFDALREYLRD